MRNVAWTVLGVGFFVLIGALWHLPDSGTQTPQHDTLRNSTMIVRSPAFNHEETIPSKYTCDGEDVSPPLAVDALPKETVSLALIVDDPDAPEHAWDHWILYNIPATTTRIAEGGLPPGLRGLNSWGRTSYGGPCPPSGEHRYLFKVYALDVMLPLASDARKEDVLRTMEGHILESTTLMGRYARPLES